MNEHDYSLKVTVRNARILNAIKEAGYDSQASFCRDNGLHVSHVNALIGLRAPAVSEVDGRLTATAQGLCDALCALPQDLWTDEQLWSRLPRNTWQFEISRDQIQGFIDSKTMDEQFEAYGAMTLLEVLRPREKKALESWILDDKTLKEVGKEMDVTVERVRQLSYRGLRRIRKAVASLEGGPRPMAVG